MGLNFKKLRELNVRIKEHADEEIKENFIQDFTNLILDEDLRINYDERKKRDVPELSKRVISHWIKMKITEGIQTSKGGWYKFSRLETIWIEIITQLRQFGLKLELIKNIRTELFNTGDKSIPLIEHALMHSILKEPQILIIFQDGQILIHSISKYVEILLEDTLPPHISINFFQVAIGIFPNNNFHLETDSKEVDKLSDSELKLLYYIRTGDYQEIRVRQKKGTISLIEGNRKVENMDDIKEIITKGGYQDIKVKTQNGNTVYIKVTDKYKM